jgi:excisionase family DNA binding protein
MQEWLTLSEAAERLGISVQTARRWARDGKLPAEQQPGARGTEFRVRADALPTLPAAPLPSADAVELAASLASLRTELRAATSEQAAREATLRTELEKTRTELGAALEALRQTRETVADLHRQLEDRDKQLEAKTRALVSARRQVAARESGRLSVLRENLQEGQRPWWRRLKGKEKE